MNIADAHDAAMERRDQRILNAVGVLESSLKIIADRDGLTVYTQDDGSFAIDLPDGDIIEFLGGVSSELTFSVELSDGYKTDVNYDVKMMPAFDDEIAAFEHIARHPMSWCKDTIDLAKARAVRERRDAA